MKIDKLTKSSHINIKYVFENYKKMNPINNKFIKLLYKLIDKTRYIEASHTIKEMNKQPELVSNIFLSNEIKNTINHTHYKCFAISIKIDKALFSIDLFTKDRINIKRFIFYIKVVLKLCYKSSLSKESSYNFKIILTDVVKTQSMNEPTINSGYTINRDVVIYRKEEFLKVFIHECFHMFCLDFSTHDIDYKVMFEPLFHINSDFLIFESLCEFWARTINVSLLSYYKQAVPCYKEFERAFIINLNFERVFSMIQMCNYLSYFKLKYEDLLKGNSVYSESTNGFCYYVLTPILLYNYQSTMNWFIHHNETLLQFSKSERDIYLFYHYIKSIYKTRELLEYIKSMNRCKLNNMMMSVFDFNIF